MVFGNLFNTDYEGQLKAMGDTVRINSIGDVSVYSYVKDKMAFYGWIRETGQEDLFSVNYQTMNSMVKTSLVDGKEVPPGIEPYFKQSISIRGVKNLNGDQEG